ncbi:hypothetical protein PENSPDRAFT_679126 [Peniophora sp. CONT]|nr:hypothetical protein PENSPDRAFT_679126 [Peniophora sp. CONT]
MTSMAPSSSRSAESSHRRLESSPSPSASSVYTSPRQLAQSSWNVIEQPPPPSLREILGAYRTRGDGDREMLLAMLSAKSAEDQRIASVANLHRALLEQYNAPQVSSPYTHPQHIYPSYRHQTPDYDVHLPPVRSHAPEPAYQATYAPRSRARPYSSPDSPRAAEPERAYGPEHSRKRARPSPPAQRTSPVQSPASPSSSSDASRSPGRGSMAIDSLLLGPAPARAQSGSRVPSQSIPVSSTPIVAV